MNQIVNFSPDDLAVLRNLVYRERLRVKNTTGRGAVPSYADAEPTTEVYIAKVYAGGIPALTETLGHLNDVPGHADCDIYQILLESGIPKLRPIGATHTIYNLSLQDIVEADTPWIAIKREKFGSWLADGVGAVGSGGDFDCDALVACEPECGYLILNCPEVGTGSYVAPGTGTHFAGYLSPCNDGDIVLTTIHLSVAYGGDAVSIPMTTTDGNTWRYTGPTVDVGSCGAGLRVVEAALICDPPWRLELDLDLPTLQAFGNPADFPNWTMVSSSPMYWTTQTYTPVTTGCGFEVIELALSE